MACAGRIIANSAKLEIRNLFMVQPRMKMGERVPVNPCSGRPRRCEKHVNHGCHCSEHNPYKSLRGLFFLSAIRLVGLKSSVCERCVDTRRRTRVAPVKLPSQVSNSSEEIAVTSVDKYS